MDSESEREGNLSHPNVSLSLSFFTCKTGSMMSVPDGRAEASGDGLHSSLRDSPTKQVRTAVPLSFNGVELLRLFLGLFWACGCLD